MSCHHHYHQRRLQKKSNNRKNNVSFEDDCTLKSNQEQIKNQPQSSAHNKQSNGIASDMKKSRNSRKSKAKKISKDYCYGHVSSNTEKIIPEHCELHSKRGKSNSVTTNELPKEFRHACSMCPGDFSHTSCKYCIDEEKEEDTQQEDSIDNAGNFKHTSCKYCFTDKTKARKVKQDLNHDTNSSEKFSRSCKYCLDNIPEKLDESSLSETSSTDSLEEFFNEINTYMPCSLHGAYRNKSDIADQPEFVYNTFYNQRHPRRRNIYKTDGNICNFCEEPSSCLINDSTEEFPTRFQDRTVHNRRPYFIPRLDLPNDISDTGYFSYIKSRANGIRPKENLSSMFSSVKLQSCEFCLRNGETEVIYNSHQLRNSRGIITCPILRHYTYSIDGTAEYLNHHVSNPKLFGCDVCSANNTVPEVPEASCHYNGCCNFSEDLFHSPKYHSKTHENGQYAFNSNGFATYQEIHRNGIINSTFPSTSGIRTSNSTIPCQFCLTNGEPPHIYNSHQMRDNAGITLKCPILKRRMESNSHTCTNCANNSISEAHVPLVRHISNGSLNKRQYLDLLNCLT